MSAKTMGNGPTDGVTVIQAVGRRLGRLALRAARLGTYGIMALLRPLLIPVLTWLAVGGVVLWVIFVPVAHDTGFPTLRVLGMSAACAACAVLYYAAMDLLVPASIGKGR